MHFHALRRWFRFSSTSLCVFATLSACGGGHARSEHTPAPSPVAILQQSAQRAIDQGLAGVYLGHLQGASLEGQALGRRRLDATEPVHADDLFLIGSTTKAMTAALAGRLVEQGVIAWTTTLAEALPELAPAMRPVYQSVTLEQLLNHRGGVLAFTDDTDDDRFAAVLDDAALRLPTTLAGRERFFAAWLLAQDPPAGVTPGRDFHYSNAGYALAALMLEARSGTRYTDLLARELAQPLGIELNWVGADQALLGRPIGHEGKLGQLKALAAMDQPLARWTEVLQAAGPGLSIRPADYARWLQWHLKALRGERTPLADGYVRRLQALTAGGYALGWTLTDVDGRAVLAHDGEYLGFSSLAVIDRLGRSASFAFSNSAEPETEWPLKVLNQTLLDVERQLPVP
ncbi:serine hydrolase domain-containing protein [Roseateles sp.]|uniref:serine hydrolase domain-containing protein n=1 Tax=Roseateles sp. TaxID=1971397 RepID=UPI0039431D75